MKNITSVGDVMLCPSCDSYNCYGYNTDEIELGPNGTGHYRVDCHCSECGRDFRLCIEFEYSITKSYAR